jgi:hypothetical protein
MVVDVAPSWKTPLLKSSAQRSAAATSGSASHEPSPDAAS